MLLVWSARSLVLCAFGLAPFKSATLLQYASSPLASSRHLNRRAVHLPALVFGVLLPLQRGVHSLLEVLEAQAALSPQDVQHGGARARVHTDLGLGGVLRLLDHDANLRMVLVGGVRGRRVGRRGAIMPADIL